MALTHTVRQGECLSSIARSYGFEDWRFIYWHPTNDEFRQKRPNPNVIYPGDELFIPDPEGESPCATDQKHTFELKRDSTLLRLLLDDSNDRPITDAPYTLAIGPLAPLEGKTDGEGRLEHEIPPETVTAILNVYPAGKKNPPIVWELSVGSLDPVEQVKGFQARLNNMAYESGPVDGIQGPLTTGAVKRFQTKQKIQVDGIVGPQTRGKLKEVHGC